MFGFRSDVIIEYWPLFVNGAFMTVKITVICVLLGMILGTLLGMGRLASARHEPLKGLLHYGVRWPVAVYVSFFRGTPLFVQIFLMHFAVLPLFIHPVDGLLIDGPLAREIRANYGAVLAGICAITLNSGAYMCEIFRAGIQAIPAGQYEAAHTLGMNYVQTMRRIILPQVIRIILPPISNETITLVKDTSLVYVLAMNDLMRTARNLVQRDFSITPFIVAAVFYLLATLILTIVFERLEKRFSRYDQ